MLMKQRHKDLVTTWVKDHRRIVFIVGGVLLLIIFLQVLYPSDRALPFSKLNGDSVGFSSDQVIAKKLQADYGKVNVTTIIRDKTTKTSIAESGLVPDNKTILNGLGDYPWYLRIVPFSSLIRGSLINQPIALTTDGPKFSVYASQRLKDCEVAPKNAGVVVKEGEVVLDAAVDGQKCTADDIKNQLIWEPLTKSGKTMKIKTIAVKPARSDRDVQPLLKRAQGIAEYKISLVIASKTYAIDKPTLASWLAFPEDPETKQPTVGLNDEAVKTYLTSIQKDVYIAPGVTLVTTKDSLETARVVGSSGRGIDQPRTVEAIREQVLAGDGTVTATLTTLAPTLKYDRSYSKTPEGLQALVNDIVKDKGDFAISVRKLGDTGVHANGDKTYHPASTYKLFVAYSVLKRVDANQMSLGQTTSGGQTLAQCLDNMIVNSDNACAEWFGVAIGWNTLTNEARAMGASRTVLSKPFVSTPNDQALLLQKLESNQLALAEPSRERLISAMKRQVFRKGIPAGIGVPVANKVGFFDGYLHDSAIVYSPGGVYILVIYTNGSSWSAIADAAKQIHTQLQ